MPCVFFSSHFSRLFDSPTAITLKMYTHFQQVAFLSITRRRAEHVRKVRKRKLRMKLEWEWKWAELSGRNGFFRCKFFLTDYVRDVTMIHWCWWLDWKSKIRDFSLLIPIFVRSVILYRRAHREWELEKKSANNQSQFHAQLDSLPYRKRQIQSIGVRVHFSREWTHNISSS